MARVTAALAAAVLVGGARAAVQMPSIFSDGLVLQCNVAYDQRPYVYGRAAPGEIVQVNRTSPAGAVQQSYSATADADGSWISQLNADCEVGPFALVVAGSSDGYATRTVIENVTYGDVFLCSGQSNMKMSVRAAFNASLVVNNTYPNIRLFAVAQNASLTPQFDFPEPAGDATPCWWPDTGLPPLPNYRCNQWQPATPDSIPDFSAACFYSLLELSQQFPGRTFAGIFSAYDGTIMEAWSPPEVLETCNGTAAEPSTEPLAVDTQVAPLALSGPPAPNTPTVLFNAMINPLVRFAIRGVFWYQGEGNSGNTEARFSCLFNAMIAAWRTRWQIGDFAFVFAQLAPADSSVWPNYYIYGARMAQSSALPAPGVNNTCITGQATLTDVGDIFSPYPPVHVHSRRKREAGHRLALAMLHTQYAMQMYTGGAPMAPVAFNVNWRGPEPVALTAGAGGTFTLRFNTLDGQGIALADTADCWECCAKGQDTIQIGNYGGWQWVNASIAVSPTDNSTLVVTPLGAAPSGGFQQVRGLASLWPQCSVMAVGNGLPAGPFAIRLSTSSSASDAKAGATAAEKRAKFAAARAALLEQRARVMPLAQPGPKTWTSWKGRALPPPVAPSWVAEAAGSGNITAPPAGFNSWNAFHTSIDESILRHVADTLVSTGLAALGFDRVHIDDGWQVDRDPVTGAIIPDPVRFPSGLSALADYIHSKGLLFGVYSAQHEWTCQYRPGSYQFEAVDAQTYCDNGVDALKMDGCWGASWPALNESWIRIRQGFDACAAATGRQILLSVESCGKTNPQGCQQWLPKLANMWRTTNDIQATWPSVLYNLDNNNEGGLPAIASAGHYNDADMLEVGNAGLTYDEQKSHMSAWAVIMSPLLIGTDVTVMSNQTLSLFSAPEVMAVSQDPLNVQGVRVSAANPTGAECWARPLADGSVAALLLQRGAAGPVTCTWDQIGLKNPNGAAAVRDLWARADVGSFTGGYTAQLGEHACALVRVSQ